MEDERPVVTWMPVVPGFGVTLIVTAFVFFLGSALAAAALVYLVWSLVRRAWSPWSWVALGAVIAYAVYWLLLVLHALF